MAPLAHKLVGELAGSGPLALYDPDRRAGEVAALYDLAACDLREAYVQRLEDLDRPVLGLPARPLGELARSRAETLLVVAFDAERLLTQLEPLRPAGLRVVTLDAVRLPETLLTRPERYLDPLNFATSFALFRDGEGRHTRLVTANYWHEYGARGVRLWLCLFDAEGRRLAHWEEALPDAPVRVAIESEQVRRRFGLGPFAGSLFLHAVGAAGHDVVKYAQDEWSDAGALSGSHDANPWPADRYAGLPAPGAGERVLLWVQNSHPAPIRAGALGVRRMGHREDGAAWTPLPDEIPGFATRAVDVGALLPGVRWPAQLEVRAGRHFVRPRYEVVRASGQRCIAHANVERSDLAPDPRLPALGRWLGKGFVLPAPILPGDAWRTIALPTPMATAQRELPLRLLVYDASGRAVLEERLGRLPRDHATAIDVGERLARAGVALESGYGHFELAYDFADGGAGDGWLHALFRYEHESGHRAETSFGSHVYNLPVTYRNEPQSYGSRPPGLSTRLFLRLGEEPACRDTLCHLIYPCSGRWRPASNTALELRDAAGREVARRELAVPESGSRLWRYRELFDAAEQRRAGAGAYLMVRDAGCRLFGFHGLLGADGAFSLDHLFGF